jgi:hypothetical protein
VFILFLSYELNIIPKFFGMFLGGLLCAFVSGAFDILPHIMANSNIVLIDEI